jgi:hypothetical protein
MDGRLDRAFALALLGVAACAGPERTEEPRAEPTSAPPAERAASALAFRPRPGWEVVPVTSASRAAEFRLPPASGDDEAASLVVYHFGGGGGSVAANLERWLAQVEPPGGRSAREVANVTEDRRGGLAITTVDVAGRYVAETAPGSGERLDRPGWRLVASVIEAEGGPWYAKLVGPERTVARWRASYTDFLGSLARP